MGDVGRRLFYLNVPADCSTAVYTRGAVITPAPDSRSGRRGTLDSRAEPARHVDISYELQRRATDQRRSFTLVLGGTADSAPRYTP